MILLLSTGPLKIVVAKPHWHLHRLDLLSGLQEKKDPKQWPIHPQRTTPNASYSQIWSLTRPECICLVMIPAVRPNTSLVKTVKPGKTSQQPIQIIQSKWPLRTAFCGVCAPHTHSPQADNIIYGFEWHAFAWKLCIVAAGQNDQTLTWSAGDVVIWCYMCLLWIVVWPMIGTYEEETGRSISVWWCVAAEAKIIQVLLPRYPGSFRWHFQPQRMSMRTLRRTVGPPSWSWIFCRFTTSWTWSDFIHLDRRMDLNIFAYMR